MNDNNDLDEIKNLLKKKLGGLLAELKKLDNNLDNLSKYKVDLKFILNSIVNNPEIMNDPQIGKEVNKLRITLYNYLITLGNKDKSSINPTYLEDFKNISKLIVEKLKEAA